MSVEEVLVFDGDDTLWFVEALYDGARASARLLVERAGLDGEKWETFQRSIDVKNVERLGLSPNRFPTSCLEAYREVAKLANTAVDDALEREIADASAQVFHEAAPLASGAIEVLSELNANFRLALLTKGHPTIQERRVTQSGLRGFFEVVSIVPMKDEAAFEAVLSSLHLNPRDAWSIGNSIPSDIKPAVRLGMSAVWIDAHVWEHELRDQELGEGRVIEVGTLHEVPDALRQARSAA